MLKHSTRSGWIARLGALLLGAVASLSALPAWAADNAITWGKPSEILGYDPHVETNGVSWQFLFLTYETLVTTGQNLDVQPQLAASWTQDSPTSYTFTLREGAKFSNGRAVTADDVVGSIQRVIDPALASVWAAQLGPIKDVVALDAHTVRIDLAEPYAPLLAALANIQAAILPIAELKAGTFDPSKTLLGSGPYIVEAHNQDQSWTFAANPDYPEALRPKVPTLNVEIIPDDSARIAALRDGRVDIATFESPDVPALLAGIPNVETVVQATTNYYRLDVNALGENSPFKDARLREALTLALDRDAIGDIALAGTSQADYPLPRAFPQSDACAALPSYVGDRATRLEKAKALVAEVGNGAPVKVQLIASPSVATFPLIAQVIQSSLADANIEVEILQLPAADWLERSFTTGDFDFAVSWFTGYADPSLVLGWWNPDFAQWNKVFLPADADLSAQISLAKQTADGPERQALFTSICETIDAQAGIISLVGKPDIVGIRTDQINATIQPAEGYFQTLKNLPSFTRTGN
ncbi:ABC transporter substrate-binding protein [Devosia epidermidihirudinis]|nr:ABC transporter substrate-binding protein [Devosia epidermidihirudinis]